MLMCPPKSEACFFSLLFSKFRWWWGAHTCFWFRINSSLTNYSFLAIQVLPIVSEDHGHWDSGILFIWFAFFPQGLCIRLMNTDPQLVSALGSLRKGNELDHSSLIALATIRTNTERRARTKNGLCGLESKAQCGSWLDSQQSCSLL